MPISENLCWQVLKRIKGESTLNRWLTGEESDDESVIKNAVPLFVLEKELVLKYVKSQIEDRVYLKV